jgi:hypothetical protein
MEEAAAHFQLALDQLALLPDTPPRQRKELEFCSALGAALRFVRGQAALETGRAFTRARELWEQLGFPTEYLHIPYGQSRYYVYRGETDEALRLDEDLLRVSRLRDDSRRRSGSAAASYLLNETPSSVFRLDTGEAGTQSGPRFGARGAFGQKRE